MHPQLLPSRAVLQDQLCLAWEPGAHQCPRDAGRILLSLELSWEGTHTRFAHLENTSRSRWMSDKWEPPHPQNRGAHHEIPQLHAASTSNKRNSTPLHLHNGVYTQWVNKFLQLNRISEHLCTSGSPAVPFLPQKNNSSLLCLRILCDSSSKVPVKQMRDRSTEQLALAKWLPAKSGKAGRLPTTPLAPH